MEMSMNRKYYEMHRVELIYVSKVLKLSLYLDMILIMGSICMC